MSEIAQLYAANRLINTQRAWVVWTLVVLPKISAGTSVVLAGYVLSVDQGTATIMAAVVLALSSMWQSWMLGKVHTLVNSNFTEAKFARQVAESALKVAVDLNTHLQHQLDLKLTGPTGRTGAAGEPGPIGPTGDTGLTGATGPKAT